MFEKIKLALSVLHQGQAIIAAAKVKNWTLVGNGLAALASVALIFLRMTGHDIPLTDEDLVKLGAAIAVVMGLLNPVSAVITSDKIGLSAAPRQLQTTDSNTAIDARVSTAVTQPDEVRTVNQASPPLRVVPSFFRDEDHSGS